MLMEDYTAILTGSCDVLAVKFNLLTETPQ